MLEIKNYADELIRKLDIKNLVGVFLYGSYSTGENNDLSDLDFMIIADNHDTQDCGSMIINNIRVEFFVQDYKRLYELARKQIIANDPSHLTKFINCKIIYDKDDKIKKFIEFATELYETNIKKQYTDYEKFGIFSINNRMEDLYSLINHEEFYSVYYVVLEKIRNLYAKIYGHIELPLTKIRKIYTDDEFMRKYIKSDIYNLPNEPFINLYLDCLSIDNQNTMYEKIQKLYNYSFSKLDFKPDNFILKYKSNPPFKL